MASLPCLLRYFTNISIGGRDYSFNSDGYLSNPLLDVISYINGRGWEEVSAPGDANGQRRAGHCTKSAI